MTLSKSALQAWGLLVATLVVPAASQAADPPGGLALDWPMGFHDGTQLLPGYDRRRVRRPGRDR